MTRCSNLHHYPWETETNRQRQRNTEIITELESERAKGVNNWVLTKKKLISWSRLSRLTGGVIWYEFESPSFGWVWAKNTPKYPQTLNALPNALLKSCFQNFGWCRQEKGDILKTVLCGVLALGGNHELFRGLNMVKIWFLHWPSCARRGGG